MKILVHFCFLLSFSFLLTACGEEQSTALQPIKIGDISPYTGFAYYAEPYKKGWQLALAEVNQAGGVCFKGGEECHLLEVISRDSRANPADAVQVAQDLVLTEGVFALIGPMLSHVGLAVSEFAERQKIPLITSLTTTDTLLKEKGHPYVFRVHLGAEETTSYLEDHLRVTTAKRFAVVAENYEAGHAYTKAFLNHVKKHIPGVQVIEEQYPPLGQIEAGSVVQALKKAQPEGLFVFLLGPNMTAFLREIKLRGLENITVFNPDLGFPEEMARYGKDLPEGWHVIGLPNAQTSGHAYNRFYNMFLEKYGIPPSRPAVLGYVLLKSVAAALEKSGPNREVFLKALSTPLFPFFHDEFFTFREKDHQGTFIFAVGKTAVKDGEPTFMQKN